MSTPVPSHVLFDEVAAVLGLDAAAFEDVAPAAVRLHVLDAGGRLGTGREPSGCLFVLLDGEVSVRVRLGDRVAEVTTRGAGESFGDLTSLVGGRDAAEVVATSAARVVELGATAVTALATADPAFARQNHESVSRSLRHARVTAALLARLGEEHRGAIDELADRVAFERLAAGATLFERGDRPDAAYVLVQGRLHAVDPDHEGPLLGTAGGIEPGELVGELGLLRDAPRARTVVATRDAVLARIDRASFALLADTHPRTVHAFTVQLLDRILEPATRRTATQRTVAVLPAHPGVGSHALVTAASSWLSARSTSIVLSSSVVDEALGVPGAAHTETDDPASLRIHDWLEELEREHDVVVLECDPGWTGWTTRALRQADTVLVVAEAGDDPAPSATEQRAAELVAGLAARPRVTLVLLHGSDADVPTGTAAWLDARAVDDHAHVRAGDEGDLGRLLRHVTGTPVALVLGGGGAKGFAHIGVRRAMHELGIPVDASFGASIGSVIAWTDAGGLHPAGAEDFFADAFANLLDYTLPSVAALKGGRITETIERSCRGRDLEDGWVPFSVLVTNLTTAEEVLVRRGPMARTVRASVSIPGVLPPVALDGDVLVDGGTTNNLPADHARRLHPTGRVLAVDVAPSGGPRAKAAFPPVVSGWGRLGRRLTPGLRNDPVPGLLTTLIASTVVASGRDRNRTVASGDVDLLLDLDLRGFGLLDFGAVRVAAAKGYAAALEPLAAWWATQPDGDPEAVAHAAELLAAHGAEDAG